MNMPSSFPARLALGALLWFFCRVAAAATNGDWVIAQIAPFSGPSASVGNDLRAGAQIAINGVNTRGGIAGRKLRLAFADDQQNAEKAAAAAQTLIAREHPIALFGSGGTDTTTALLRSELVRSNGLALIGARTGAARLVADGPANLFLTRASYADEISALLRHCLSAGIQKLAVIYQDDAVGRDLLVTTAELAEHFRIQLVARVPYVTKPSTGAVATPDVSAAISMVQKHAHQALLLATEMDSTQSLLAFYRGTEAPAPVMTLSINDGELIAQNIGLSRARGLWVSQTTPAPRNAGIPLVRKLQADLKAGGMEPSDAADFRTTAGMLEGYIAMQVLIEGLRRAGPAADPGKLAQALQGLHGLDLGGYTIGYDNAGRNGSRFVEIGVVGREGDILR